MHTKPRVARHRVAQKFPPESRACRTHMGNVYFDQTAEMEYTPTHLSTNNP